METESHINTSTTFPKRIRSVSARIFSISSLSDLHHDKRASCQQFMPSLPNNIMTAAATTTTTIEQLKSPSKWFPKIRCRSSSSASSTFSLVFSSSFMTEDPSSSSCSTTATWTTENYYEKHHQSLESLSSELEELYKTAKEEIAYAIESQGSIYYEGDRLTASTAFELCETKYNVVMHMFGDTANAIKFRFRWEMDLHQLRLAFNSLPTVNQSIYDD